MGYGNDTTIIERPYFLSYPIVRPAYVKTSRMDYINIFQDYYDASPSNACTAAAFY
ncbi:Uncharacterized protein APZ42_002409 [Daphnia magna]|uniref:Uncharacterized protein n=1 Tax=Daphnia magna TaxID=35525 RepID=A0A164IA46_9CRUS|nr:Uncharacterized protein APZ42_002409 [Daphnia magna]